MSRRAAVLFLIGVIGAGALSAQTASQNQTASQRRTAPSGPRPIASVRQLHDMLITPSSDAVFAAAGEPPRAEAGWAEAHRQATLLAEGGNLLMVGSRARDNDQWMRMSRALVDAAALAAAAAEKRDATTIAAASDAITTACESCHQPYRDGGRQMRGNSK